MSYEALRDRIPKFDVANRYVRFRELRADGYVLFDFAIGEPDLSVELVLPLPAYQAFCRSNHVTYLTREEIAALDYERLKWRFGAPGTEN